MGSGIFAARVVAFLLQRTAANKEVHRHLDIEKLHPSRYGILEIREFPQCRTSAFGRKRPVDTNVPSAVSANKLYACPSWREGFLTYLQLA